MRSRALVVAHVVAAAIASASCAPHSSRPGAQAVALPAPTQREWTRLRERLAIDRSAIPQRPYVEQIVVAMREPRTGHVFQARGAVAIDPRHAVRMILLGPGGTTALDAWVTDDRFRVVVPPIALERRGGAEPGAARGLPVGFFRWWMLHPLDGRLLAAWSRRGGPMYLLRRGDDTVLLREARLPHTLREHVIAGRRDVGESERLEWMGRAPGTPHVGDKARYIDGVSGLEVEVLIEGVSDHEPDPAAFLDPDADAKGAPL